jgi:integrase
MINNHPGAGSYQDRHGRTRWRYRRAGKTISLPGAPGEPEFEEAYAAAVEGRERKGAEIRRHPSAALPRTFGAAWRLVLVSPEWVRLDPATKKQNTTLAEAFLLDRVDPAFEDLWRDIPVADFRRRHMKLILSRKASTPHVAKHQMTAIRRMINAAMDEEWIEFDPTLKMNWRPPTTGFRAWTDHEIEAFETRWAPGTNARLVFALAVWLGNRRGDIADLRWDQRRKVRVTIDNAPQEVDVFDLRQMKGDKRLFVPVTPMLEDVLSATPVKGPTILVTAYGKPFSGKSLTGHMALWTKAAGLEPGCTIHGLRKTLGRFLAEGDASTRQLMDILGHDNIEHAELYSRDAEQIRLAHAGMAKVVSLRRRGEPGG